MTNLNNLQKSVQCIFFNGMEKNGKNKANLRILLISGSRCTRNEHIINNYDDISYILFLQKLFVELYEVPQVHIFLSYIARDPVFSISQALKNFETPSNHYHIDYSGKHYSFPIANISGNIKCFEYQVRGILKRDSCGKIVEQDPIDLMIYFKDHGSKLSFDDSIKTYAELLILLETHVPSKYRNRTIVFNDSCYTNSFLYVDEYWKTFFSLFPTAITEDHIESVFIFLRECNDESILSISESKIIKRIDKAQSIYCQGPYKNIFSHIDKEKLGSFIKKFHKLISNKCSPLQLKSFFSKPIWLFSSLEKIPTLIYPYRKIQKEYDECKPDNASDDFEAEKISNEIQVLNTTTTDEAKINELFNYTFNHQTDTENKNTNFDITKLGIDICEKSVYYIQTSSFFTNAVISALFPQQNEAKIITEYDVESFKQIITDNMNSQIISFSESQYFISATKNLSELQTEYAELQEEYNKYNAEQLDSYIISKTEELKKMKESKNTLVSAFFSSLISNSQNSNVLHLIINYQQIIIQLKELTKLQTDKNKDPKIIEETNTKIKLLRDQKKDILNSIFEVSKESNYDIYEQHQQLIKNIMLLKVQIRDLTEKLRKAKELNHKLDQYSKYLEDIKNEIKDVHDYFNIWKDNSQLHFKEFNTDDSQFIEFHHLQKKPFSKIPYENEITFNDYTYFDHTYSPLFKTFVTSDKAYIPDTKYMKWQRGFNSDYRDAIDARLKQLGYPKMDHYYPQDSFSKESSSFYDSFLSCVDDKFGGYYAVYVGGVMRDIRGYYDKIKPKNEIPLIQVLILAVGDVDKQWREEYLRKLEMKRILKQKQKK